MKAIQVFSEKIARKWMWIGLATFVALQMYFVQEMLAALVLFTIAFAVFAIIALVLYVVDRAGQWGLDGLDSTPDRRLNWHAVDWRWRKTSVKSHSAVHVQSLSGNRTGLIRAKKEGGGGDFIGCLPATLQNPAEKRGKLSLWRHARLFGQRVPSIL